MTKVKKYTTPGGYHAFPHHLLIGVKEGVLTTSLLGAYMVLVSIAEFEAGRPTYGVINRTYEELGKTLHVSPSTAQRWVQKLIKKNLLTDKSIPENSSSVVACNYYWSFRPQVALVLARVRFKDWNDIIQTLEKIDIQIRNNKIIAAQEIVAITQSVTSEKAGTIFNTPLKIGNFNQSKGIGNKGNEIKKQKDPNCRLCSPGTGKGDYCVNCIKDVDDTFK